MPETEAMLTIAPFPCLTMCGSTCLQVRKHALHVYVVDPVPTLLAGLDRAADLDDAYIVVKYVDPAECQYASIDHRSNVIRTGHVSSNRLADAAFRLDYSLGLEGGSEIDVDRDDSCPFAGKEHRRRLAVAPT